MATRYSDLKPTAQEERDFNCRPEGSIVLVYSLSFFRINCMFYALVATAQVLTWL